MVSEEVVVFDNLEGRMKMISLIDADDVGASHQMHRRLQEREGALAAPVTGLEHGNANQTLRESDFVSEFGEEAFSGSGRDH